MTGEQLIADFRRMLAEKWGYIPSTSGETWTKEKQQKAAAKSDTVARHGSQWIGHRVADCSGAFVWAYRQHGMSIYHGSNRIAREYLAERGAALIPMSEAKPGMAAFKVRRPGQKGYELPDEYRQGGAHYNGDLNDYYHIGLVDMDGSIINAQSTAKGVQRSKASGWSCAGYLTAVEYGKEEGTMDKTMTVISENGKPVNLRKAASLNANLVCTMPVGSEVQLMGTTNTGWSAVKYGERTGYVMSRFLREGEAVDDMDSLPVEDDQTMDRARDALYAAREVIDKALLLLSPAG